MYALWHCCSQPLHPDKVQRTAPVCQESQSRGRAAPELLLWRWAVVALLELPRSGFCFWLCRQCNRADNTLLVWDQPDAWTILCLSLFFSLCLPSKSSRGTEEWAPCGSADLLPQLFVLSAARCIPPARHIPPDPGLGSELDPGLGAGPSSAPLCWWHWCPCREQQPCACLLLALRCSLLEQCAVHTQLCKEEKKPKSACTPGSLTMCEETI